jgi:hypothetical protein
VSRSTASKWRHQFLDGEWSLNRSRRPLSSPNQTPEKDEGGFCTCASVRARRRTHRRAFGLVVSTVDRTLVSHPRQQPRGSVNLAAGRSQVSTVEPVAIYVTRLPTLDQFQTIEIVDGPRLRN